MAEHWVTLDICFEAEDEYDADVKVLQLTERVLELPTVIEVGGERVSNRG